MLLIDHHKAVIDGCNLRYNLDLPRTCPQTELKTAYANNEYLTIHPQKSTRPYQPTTTTQHNHLKINKLNVTLDKKLDTARSTTYALIR